MLDLNFRSVRLVGMLCVVLLWATRAQAASVTLAWDPSPDLDVVGYTVGYGTQPGQYVVLLDAGPNMTFTIDSLADGTYYFAVRAYTSDGLSSGFSNEVVATVTSGGTTATPPPPPPPASSCTTPDPFIALGGGTCYGGGWLPPGMPLPGGSTQPAPAPAPTPAPAPSAGCSTADPFAALGGGTCYNGGWLPPGMPVPGGSPAPAPAPTPTPTTPPPPPPSSVGTCSTPDPFAALGGGTCYNGGWLPPGMAAPGGSPAPAPAPAPTPTTPPPPPATNSGSCATPDPFVALGGGTCYGGGWLPPGMPVPNGGSSTSAPAPAPTPESPTGVQLACVTADPFLALGGGTCHNGAWLPPGMEITVNGTLRVLSLEDGLWFIEGEDGTLYTSSSELPAEMLIEGATVTVIALTLPSASGTEGAALLELIDIEIHQ